MKKIISLLVAAVMVFALGAGAAMAADDDLTGTWYAQSMESEGQTMDASILEAMGMNFILTLNEDGTAVVEMGGQKMEATWGDGKIKLEDSEITYEAADGQLKAQNESGALTFGREAPEKLDITLAPVVENPQISDFNGAWKTVVYVAMGFPLPMTMAAGIDFTLDIKDGAVTINQVTYDTETHSEITDTTEKNFTAQLQDDGTLLVPFGEEELLSALAPGASGIILTLHEDGRMSGEIPEVTEQMQMFAALMADSETAEAESAESAEVAPAETADAPAAEEGASDGSSSGEISMSAYIIFEKEAE